MRGLTTPRVLRPIRDGWVIPRDERDRVCRRAASAMPIIVGTNRDEGTGFVAAWPVQDVAAYRASSTENFGAAMEVALSLYPVAADTEAKPRVAEMFADTQFNYGVWALARAMARSGKGTWRYLFTKKRVGPDDGAASRRRGRIRVRRPGRADAEGRPVRCRRYRRCPTR